MKKSVLFICSFFLVSYAFGQGGSRPQPAQIQQLQQAMLQPRILAETNRHNIEGSPFYNEDWQKGYVIVNDKSTSGTVDLKYSTYTNEVLFIGDGEQAMALPPNAIQGFVLTSEPEDVVFKNGFISNEHDISSNLLLRVLYDGKVKMLAKEETSLHKSEDAFTGQMEYTFLSNTDYFLRTTDGQFHKIKLKDSHVLEVLGQNQDKLKQYADTNDLDFGEESDLKQILAEYEKMTQNTH